MLVPRMSRARKSTRREGGYQFLVLRLHQTLPRRSFRDHLLRRRSAVTVVALALGGVFLACGGSVVPTSSPRVERVTYIAAGTYLALEVLDDDLIHFELASGRAPDTRTPLYTTPMVSKTDYAGPSRFTNNGRGVLE